MFRNAWFIARKDVQYLLKDRSTFIWIFVMPALFFYFIGTVTGGFGGALVSAQPQIAVEVLEDAGFLSEQLIHQLEQNGYEAIVFTSEQAISQDSPEDYGYRIVVPAGFTNQLLNGQQVELKMYLDEEDIGGQFNVVKVNRAAYTLLADFIALSVDDGDVSAEALIQLNGLPRNIKVDERPAGERVVIPSGFEQSIPGILVMFTLLVMLTSGATLLVQERNAGLLLRLASTPISRGEIVLGKWGGKMILGMIQILFGILLGTLLFNMDWGSDLLMIILVLFAWGAFCASLGILLGSVGSTEGQVAGLGVLASMGLAALGGAWWPIEVTPQWMQSLQLLLPSGWAMDAMHKLISFQAGPLSVLMNLGLLLILALIVGWLGSRQFKYQ